MHAVIWQVQVRRHPAPMSSEERNHYRFHLLDEDAEVGRADVSGTVTLKTVCSVP